MKVKVKCPKCERTLLVTLKTETYDEVVEMSCVSCTHVFKFAARRKKTLFESQMDEAFRGNDFMETFKGMFGGKK